MRERLQGLEISTLSLFSSLIEHDGNKLCTIRSPHHLAAIELHVAFIVSNHKIDQVQRLLLYTKRQFPIR